MSNLNTKRKYDEFSTGSDVTLLSTNTISLDRIEQIVKKTPSENLVNAFYIFCLEFSQKHAQDLYNLSQNVIEAEKKVTLTKDEVLVAERKVGKARDEVLNLHQEREALSLKYNNLVHQQKAEHEKNLRMKNAFNIRGGIEYIKGWIKSETNSNDRWDWFVREDEQLLSCIKKASEVSKIAETTLLDALKSLYNTLSKYAHNGNVDEIVLDEGDDNPIISKPEMVLTAVLFQSFGIPYKYKGIDGKELENPFGI
jgi:hypothetical protein